MFVNAGTFPFDIHIKTNTTPIQYEDLLTWKMYHTGITNSLSIYLS